MRKKITSVILAGVFVALAFSAHAQTTKKVFRIGYVSALNPARESFRSEAIRLALQRIGYVQGQNIEVEYRYSNGNVDRAPQDAAELVRLGVDVIVVAGGDPWVRAAKNATKTIPIVMVGQGLDPVAAGLVDSLARPGGNVTGLTILNRQLSGKRLELLKEIVPKLTRVAVLYDPALPPSVVDVKEVLPGAARGLDLTLQTWEARDANGFEQVFAAINGRRSDALYVIGAPLMRANGKRIADFALRSRIPSMYDNAESVEAGGLISYAADPADSYRRIAYYVDKILKGAKPGDLPIEQPTKFELAINQRTAKQIGLTIPQSMLYRADRVIK